MSPQCRHPGLRVVEVVVVARGTGVGVVGGMEWCGVRVWQGTLRATARLAPRLAAPAWR